MVKVWLRQEPRRGGVRGARKARALIAWVLPAVLLVGSVAAQAADLERG